MVFEDPSLGVKVHRGIYDAAKALYATVMPAVTAFVEERGDATAKISLTGHSLGGRYTRNRKDEIINMN